MSAVAAVGDCGRLLVSQNFSGSDLRQFVIWRSGFRMFLYESPNNMNPIRGMRKLLGRTNPTFPGEKLWATIIW